MMSLASEYSLDNTFDDYLQYRGTRMPKEYGEKFASIIRRLEWINAAYIRQAETNVALYEKINRDYGAVVQCSEIRHINAARLHLSNIRAHCAEPALKFAKIHILIDNGSAIVVSPSRLVNDIVDDT